MNPVHDIYHMLYYRENKLIKYLLPDILSHHHSIRKVKTTHVLEPLQQSGRARLRRAVDVHRVRVPVRRLHVGVDVARGARQRLQLGRLAVRERDRAEVLARGADVLSGGHQVVTRRRADVVALLGVAATNGDRGRLSEQPVIERLSAIPVVEKTLSRQPVVEKTLSRQPVIEKTLLRQPVIEKTLSQQRRHCHDNQ